MTEPQIIEEGFQKSLANTYQVFLQAYTAALGDAGGQQTAENNFRNGILHARHVRDRALALLP